MKFVLAVCAVLAVCLVTVTPADAQEVSSDTLYTVNLIDGSRINGYITYRNHESITLMTPAGVEMRILNSSIQSTQIARGRQENGHLRRYDPNSGRLIYMPTGRPGEAGQFIFADHMLFLPSLTYNITNNVSLLGGMSIIPAVGFGDQLYFATPRVGYSFSDNVAGSAGAMFVHVAGENVGVMFASSTLGPPDKSLTVGYGVPFSLGGDISTTGVLTVGGELQLSNSIALVTENWFIIGDEGHLFSLAFRIFGDNISVDVGGLFHEEIGGFPIPWVSFSYAWGN